MSEDFLKTKYSFDAAGIHRKITLKLILKERSMWCGMDLLR